MANPTQRYVQYGAGLCAPDSWLNFDISPTLRLKRIPVFGSLFSNIGPRWPDDVRYGDIVRGLPIAQSSCLAVYCSHVLEHLSLSDFRIALRNTHDLLIPGGRFRLVLPDLEQLAAAYVSSNDHDAAIRFLNSTSLGVQERRRGMVGLLKAWMGNSAHLWMWDYKGLSQELANAGFEKTRRASFGDSGDPLFDVVEDEGQWQNCLGVECFRPEQAECGAESATG